MEDSYSSLIMLIFLTITLKFFMIKKIEDFERKEGVKEQLIISERTAS